LATKSVAYGVALYRWLRRQILCPLYVRKGPVAPMRSRHHARRWWPLDSMALPRLVRTKQLSSDRRRNPHTARLNCGLPIGVQVVSRWGQAAKRRERAGWGVQARARKIVADQASGQCGSIRRGFHQPRPVKPSTPCSRRTLQNRRGAAAPHRRLLANDEHTGLIG
jgi:hypothetical protein